MTTKLKNPPSDWGNCYKIIKGQTVPCIDYSLVPYETHCKVQKCLEWDLENHGINNEVYNLLRCTVSGNKELLQYWFWYEDFKGNEKKWFIFASQLDELLKRYSNLYNPQKEFILALEKASNGYITATYNQSDYKEMDIRYYWLENEYNPLTGQSSLNKTYRTFTVVFNDKNKYVILINRYTLSFHPYFIDFKNYSDLIKFLLPEIYKLQEANLHSFDKRVNLDQNAVYQEYSKVFQQTELIPA
jgi:hypothetical protein